MIHVVTVAEQDDQSHIQPQTLLIQIGKQALGSLIFILYSVECGTE